MSAALNVSAPKTRAEAVALVRRAARWRAGVRNFHGWVSDDTRFSATSCASLEAMLIANGWTFERGEGWSPDARERFISTACCWMHADVFATRSTFVRAVRCTIEGLAGVRPFDGISIISDAARAA